MHILLMLNCLNALYGINVILKIYIGYLMWLKPTSIN